ncbi:hypothetical protein [Cystobacter ferrugineus]|uniref:Uncharacterized protein n=1 Tax=Cystobacter ferrugineus TaxID=83449 RepID=A0A1L9AYF0_9BACT|nr:hypothetical protein [Cystobacter ferrugineus]OJH35047.1 hypothetical protein BON30_41450 [Cystobacter ferrugineus]
MRRVIPALVLSALLPLSALASVFLNGVRIDGLTNQTFDKVSSVRVDDQGNIHIVAPGYTVKTVDVPAPTAPAPTAPVAAPAAPAPTAAPVAPASPPAPAPAAPTRITQRYWLVTEQSAQGKTEYDIDLFINSAWVRKLRNGESQVITELTRYLRPGRNTVRMMASKVVTGPRRSQSAEHVFEVIIGEGNEGGGRVMIDKPLIRFQRNAAQTEDVTEEFILTTR